MGQAAPKLIAGRYEIIRALSGDGTKQVYLAEDAQQPGHRRVAIEIANDLAEPQARLQATADLERKARALVALRNVHLAEICDFVTEDSRFYLIREYIEGESLDERIRRMPKTGFASEFVVNLALQTLDGLIVLHGIDPPFIYHNLKPSNVIIAPDGNAKLIDFGLALDFAPPSVATKIGARPYAAPEQYEHRDEPQSDLYTLGAIMHHMLSGRDPAKAPPFRFQPLERLRPDLNPNLCKAVDCALAFNVRDRIQTAGEFSDALLAIKEGRPLPAFTPAPAPPVVAQHADAAPARPRSRRQPCPYCQRRIPRDARTCPYCAREIATGEIRADATSSRPSLAVLVAGGVAVAAIAIAGVYLDVRNRPPSPTPLESVVASTPASNAEAQAEAHRLALAQQFDSDLASFRGALRGSHERESLRRQIIAESIAMNPPPGLPEDALQHLDRGDAALKAGNAADAAGEFGEALDEAPWLARGYRGLASAREAAGDLHGAIGASNDYLLASPQASDALEVKSHAASLGHRILASQSDAALRNEIQSLQVKQQEQEAEQARIRAQQQAEEEAREEQQRQEQAAQQRQQAAQAQRCRENFIGRWAEYNGVCGGTTQSGTTSFLPSADGGQITSGLVAVFQIELAGDRLRVYRVVGTTCPDNRTYQTHDLAFDGTLTDQSTNYSGNCSFTASGEIHHSRPLETVPVSSVDFFVSDDGSSLTWGDQSYRRQ